MQLIFLSKDSGQVRHLSFHSLRSRLSVAFAALLVVGGAFSGGLWAAGKLGTASPSAQVAEMRADLEQQRTILAGMRAELEQDVDALALRIGQMNAHVVRLDALGGHLTQMAGLSDGEFDFSDNSNHASDALTVTWIDDDEPVLQAEISLENPSGG